MTIEQIILLIIIKYAVSYLLKIDCNVCISQLFLQEYDKFQAETNMNYYQGADDVTKAFEIKKF